MINEDTELRKLTPGQIYDLARILDRESGWKELMSLIPSDPLNSESSNCKYSVEDIRLIENASVQQSRSCTEIFFEEWGTSGRKRPTVRFLLDLLVKAELFRGADYVAEKLLNEPIPKRPANGPSSEIAISGSNTGFQATSLMISYCNRDTALYGEYSDTNHQNSSDTSDKKNTTFEENKNKEDGVNYVAFETIMSITNGLDQQVKLGSGAFGSVYLGKMDDKDVAIKVLNANDSSSNLLEHFKNELKILCQHCKHPNILPLLAVSHDKVPCLIYEFMPNGSLESRLACNFKEHSPLNWQKRVFIAKDISEGLKYLHSAFEHPIIHRDIKAANVLLNCEDVAKIGDFGLVRQHRSFETSSTALIQGTSAYMAPEALKGTISTKMDVFSFGVVLLELLTGLPAYSEERENGAALVDYVVDVIDNDEDFINLLDSKAGIWESDIWIEMYKLSKICTDGKKKLRPDIIAVNASLTILKEKC